jgi:uncharacterized membrane protein
LTDPDPSATQMPNEWAPRPNKPRHFRGFLLRGLAVVLPPILTIAILIWVGSIVNQYILVPVHGTVRYLVAWHMLDSRERSSLNSPGEALPALGKWQKSYRITNELQEELQKESSESKVEIEELKKNLEEGETGPATQDLLKRYGHEIFVPVGGRYVPLKVYERVAQNVPGEVAQTPLGLYQQYVSYMYFPGMPWLSLPNLGAMLALLALIVGIYFVGHVLALGIGRAIWHVFESRMVFRLPLVRNVYSSVKQVTDFVLSERQVQYRSVVAVQYPREGIWSLGFVTGESLQSIESAATEPVVSVLIPTSPLPMTGYTVNVRRKEVVDLNMTVDQAIQFCVSCGVVVPLGELPGRKAARPAVSSALEAVAEKTASGAEN